MSSSRIAAAALAATLAATLGATPAIAGQLQTIYTFQSAEDGNYATALSVQNGTIYGQSSSGSSGKGSCANSACGTLFALNPQTGQKTTIYGQTNPKHGGIISFALSGGNAYITSGFCKRSGCTEGTFGKIDLATGKKKTLYALDPQQPAILAGAAFRHGTFYAYNAANRGTPVLYGLNLKTRSLVYQDSSQYSSTYQVQFLGSKIIGPTDSLVFSLDPGSANETVLHYFTGNNGDGAFPEGPLYFQGTSIIGTTVTGGIAPQGTSGYGIVFKLNSKTGKETILHSFDLTDGSGPSGGLVYMNGKLYGVTVNGGAQVAPCVQRQGCGTIFEIDPATGAFTSLYQFQASTDGYFPDALVAGDSVLYGTATALPTQACPQGCGTIFAYTP